MDRRAFLKAVAWVASTVSAAIALPAAVARPRARLGPTWSEGAPLYYMQHRPCGKPAVLLTEYPAINSVAASSILRTLDSERIPAGTRVRCPHCSGFVGPDRAGIRNLDGTHVDRRFVGLQR